MTEWGLSQAKIRFAEVVENTLTVGTQRIRCDDRRVVVIAETTYQLLVERELSFKESLLQMPSLEGVNLDRGISPMRHVQL